MDDEKKKSLDEYKKKLAAEIKRARKDYEPRMTQEQLAKRIGCSKQHIYNIEKGVCSPSVEMLFSIGKATGKHLIILFRA